MKNERNPNKIFDSEGFRLPESYFEKVGDRVMEEIQLQESLPSNEGFTLPEGYFGEVEERLKAIPQSRQSKVIPFRRMMSWTAVAAVLALVLWIGWWKNSQTTSLNDLETLSQAEIQNYLEKRSSEWDTYLLGDLFSHDQLDEIALGEMPFSDEEMMQYLLEQEVFPVQP